MNDQDRHNRDANLKPWYRHPMVWFIIALPFTAVVASLVTLSIAQKNAPILILKSAPIEAVDETVEN